MHKIILVNSISDFDQLSKKYPSPAFEFYAANHYLYLNLKDQGVKYLYPRSNNTSNDLEYFYHLIRNWHRNSDGQDLLSTSGISLASVIQRSLSADFANDFRNYRALSKLLETYVCIYISIHAEKSFKNVKRVLSDKIRFYQSNNQADISFTSSPTRTVIGGFHKRRILSLLARFIQFPLRYFIRKRVMIWSDYSYGSVVKKRKDILYLNSFKPSLGFYFIESNKYKDIAEIIFPENIDKDLITAERLMKIDAIGCFSKDINLMQLFINSLLRVYAQSYLNLRSCYNSIMEAFDYYAPREIILPGETSFEHLIALQISKKLNIKSIHILDGFPVLNDLSICNFDKLGKRLLFSKYLGYGSVGYDFYVNTRRIPKDRVLLAQSPLVSIPVVKSENNDVIIMGYYPNQHNPEARWDKRFNIAFEIIKLLKQKNETSIILKIKDGNGSNYEARLYKIFFESVGLDIPIKIVEGRSYECFFSAKYVIGQASSACYECALQHVPFYLHEPYEVGTPDNYLISQVADFNNLSRTIDELKLMLLGKQPIEYSKFDSLNDGLSLDTLSFD